MWPCCAYDVSASVLNWIGHSSWRGSAVQYPDKCFRMSCYYQRTDRMPCPLHLTAPSAVLPESFTTFNYGSLDSSTMDLDIVNNGHTFQLVFPNASVYQANVTIVVAGNIWAKLAGAT